MRLCSFLVLPAPDDALMIERCHPNGRALMHFDVYCDESRPDLRMLTRNCLSGGTTNVSAPLKGAESRLYTETTSWLFSCCATSGQYS